MAGTTPAPVEAAPAADDSLANKPVPRMPDGHPDLNGIYIAPWTEVGTFTLHPEWYLQEYICDENNHDYLKLFDQYKP